MKSFTENINNRLSVVDSLRGFAIVSIVLLHNVQRFNANGMRADFPGWISMSNKFISLLVHGLFSGKSYAVFALLFGLTFFIQNFNLENKGQQFRSRFIWRMCLLLMFGLINTLFYAGEILVLYSIVGLFLLPFHKMNNKAVLISALILLFQPFLWYQLVVALIQGHSEADISLYDFYQNKMTIAIRGKSIINLMINNLIHGRIASLIWYWEVGRITQTLGLFLLGYLAGRKGIFSNSPENQKFWVNILIYSSLIFVPLVFFKYNADIFFKSQITSNYLRLVFTQWSNIAFASIMLSIFVFLYYKNIFKRIFDSFVPIGKMSLTNYIIQSIIGSGLYYGYGLSLYKYTGEFHSFLIGLFVVFIQYFYSQYWIIHHKRGPFENLWHKLTWMGTGKK